MIQVLKITAIFISAGALYGCAGPSTPLGAVWDLTPQQALASPWSPPPGALKGAGPTIRFTPGRQVLHEPAHMRIEIQDLTAQDLTQHHLTVRYNGVDVSRSFLHQSDIQYQFDQGTISIEYPLLRLNAVDEHAIDVTYISDSGQIASAQFEAPVCTAFKHETPSSFGEFNPSASMLKEISRVSNDEGLNAALLSGLIAQESGFNPRVVSWAKAIGLTQITSAAEAEVAALYPAWPRYQEIDDMNMAQIKWAIMRHRLSSQNEWRLDPAHSIEGGAVFIHMLAERWSTPENIARIRTMFPDPEVAHTQLILASYHSGYTRVQAAFDARGRDWLHSPGLREARKYVNRIFSYCSYFKEGDATHAKTTQGT